MSQSSDRFAADLEKFAQAVEARLGEMRRAVASEIFERVVARTPVATGRARASWTMTDGAPSRQVALPGRRTPAEASAEARRNATATFRDPFAVTWIVNNAPYAEALEFGASDRAPQGMVRVSLAELAAGIANRRGRR